MTTRQWGLLCWFMLIVLHYVTRYGQVSSASDVLIKELEKETKALFEEA